jgi:pimeloyl-ACP methyl ester carboxylesterase
LSHNPETMAPRRQDRSVETNHAKIWVLDSLPEDNDPTKPLILLLHGNSFCSEIWKHVFASDLANTHRIVAFDLPGHGESSDATDPERTYNMPGYADVALQVLRQIDASGSLIVVGWSLGGHIALEMLLRCDRIKGIVITGTPPVDTLEEIDKAFTFGPGGWRSAIAARASISEEELQMFARGCADPPYEGWMEKTARRTDGRARELMFGHFAGGKADPVDLDFKALDEPKLGQKRLVETSEVSCPKQRCVDGDC